MELIDKHKRENRRLLFIFILLIAATFTASLLDGQPKRLPGVALGSPLLLYCLRATAFFAIGLVYLTLIRQARDGKLPVEIKTSGIRFEETGPLHDDVKTLCAELRDRIERQERALKNTIQTTKNDQEETEEQVKL